VILKFQQSGGSGPRGLSRHGKKIKVILCNNFIPRFMAKLTQLYAKEGNTNKCKAVINLRYKREGINL
jgi:hypothetical protein